jgi:hypothetical protein
MSFYKGTLPNDELQEKSVRAAVDKMILQ